MQVRCFPQQNLTRRRRTPKEALRDVSLKTAELTPSDPQRPRWRLESALRRSVRKGVREGTTVDCKIVHQFHQKGHKALALDYCMLSMSSCSWRSSSSSACAGAGMRMGFPFGAAGIAVSSSSRSPTETSVSCENKVRNLDTKQGKHGKDAWVLEDTATGDAKVATITSLSISSCSNSSSSALSSSSSNSCPPTGFASASDISLAICSW
mmetsp:Transcript_29981/g.96135  ORF Transcript_29981/g.96135 Transcript_29981/m.96135 type:complete len:209 (+) Transcript_29981:838-1464(+)